MSNVDWLDDISIFDDDYCLVNSNNRKKSENFFEKIKNTQLDITLIKTYSAIQINDILLCCLIKNKFELFDTIVQICEKIDVEELKSYIVHHSSKINKMYVIFTYSESQLESIFNKLPVKDFNEIFLESHFIKYMSIANLKELPWNVLESKLNEYLSELEIYLFSDRRRYIKNKIIKHKEFIEALLLKLINMFGQDDSFNFFKSIINKFSKYLTEFKCEESEVFIKLYKNKEYQLLRDILKFFENNPILISTQSMLFLIIAVSSNQEEFFSLIEKYLWHKNPDNLHISFESSTYEDRMKNLEKIRKLEISDYMEICDFINKLESNYICKYYFCSLIDCNNISNFQREWIYYNEKFKKYNCDGECLRRKRVDLMILAEVHVNCLFDKDRLELNDDLLEYISYNPKCVAKLRTSSLSNVNWNLEKSIYNCKYNTPNYLIQERKVSFSPINKVRESTFDLEKETNGIINNKAIGYNECISNHSFIIFSNDFSSFIDYNSEDYENLEVYIKYNPEIIYFIEKQANEYVDILLKELTSSEDNEITIPDVIVENIILKDYLFDS